MRTAVVNGSREEDEDDDDDDDDADEGRFVRTARTMDVEEDWSWVLLKGTLYRPVDSFASNVRSTLQS